MIIVNHYQNGLKIPDSWFLIPDSFVGQWVNFLFRAGRWDKQHEWVFLRNCWVIGNSELVRCRAIWNAPTTKWSAYNEVKYTSTIISHAD